MMFLLPKQYQECPEGDHSFDASQLMDNNAPLDDCEKLLLPPPRTTKPPRSSAGASSEGVTKTTNNSNKSKNKERNALGFFTARRISKDRSGAFPLLAECQNNLVSCVSSVKHNCAAPRLQPARRVRTADSSPLSCLFQPTNTSQRIARL